MTENGFDTDKVKAMAKAISKVNSEKQRSEFTNEDEFARYAVAHNHGNIVCSRIVYFADGDGPTTSEEVAKEKFLETLNIVDKSKLSEKKRNALTTIIETAKEGNWNNRGFLEQLSNICSKFTNEEPAETNK